VEKNSEVIFAMSMKNDPEYGVYERLAVLETENISLKTEINAIKFEIKAERKSSVPYPLIWILIAATALGSGPDVLGILAKVLVK
jgi:hypothetical protein